MELNLSDYKYFPTLMTENSELLGLSELDDELKGNILPLLSLHYRKRSCFKTAIANIEKKYSGRPFFIDISNHHYFLQNLHEDDTIILKPDNYYQNWVELSTEIPNAIPVAHIFSGTTMRQLVKLSQKLEKKKKLVAFRVYNQEQANMVAAAISALDDPNNAFVFIDAGSIDGAVDQNLINSIEIQTKTILSGYEHVKICLLSSSFPNNPGYAAENEISPSCNAGKIPKLEPVLFNRVYERINDLVLEDQFLFGDYAGVYPKAQIEDVAQGGRGWFARIDFSNDDYWFVHKYTAVKYGAGFAPLAKEIIKTFPYASLPESWGKRMIQEAADKGEPFAKGFQGWVAVRINTHLTENAIYTLDGDDDLDIIF